MPKPKTQLVAVQPKMDPTIKRRKKLSANLGVLSAATGLAALGSKGLTTKQGMRLLPKASAANIKALKAVKESHKLDHTAVGLGSASGVAAAIGGGNAALVQRAELDQKTPAIKILNRRMPGVNDPLKKQKVSKVYKDHVKPSDARAYALQGKNKAKSSAIQGKKEYEVYTKTPKNIRRRRLQRERVYPYAAGAGSAAAGIGAGALLGGSYGYGTNKKKAASFRAYQGLANTRRWGNDPYAKGVRDFASKSSAKHASRVKMFRPLAMPKTGLALAGASAGLAGVSAIAHRKSKNSRNRKSQIAWWNG